MLEMEREAGQPMPPTEQTLEMTQIVEDYKQIQMVNKQDDERRDARNRS